MNAPEINTRKLITLAAQGLVITVVVSSLVLLFTSSSGTLTQLRENIQWSLVPLLALPVLISWSCNGTRFFLMCRCLGYRLSWWRATGIAISSEFGVAASPGGVGGTAIRLGFLKKSGVPFVHGGALLAADVFLDILFFSLITPFTAYALLQYVSFDKDLPLKEANPAWLAALLLPVGLFLLRKYLYHSVRQHAAFQKYRLGGRIRLGRHKMMKGFRQGRMANALIFRKHRPMLVLNFILTAVQFSSRYSILPISIWMLGTDINPLPLIMMQGALYMISMLMVAPGGGGSVEVLAAFALPQLMPVHLVGVAILLWRLFTYHFYLLFGGAVFAVTLRRVMGNKPSVSR